MSEDRICILADDEPFFTSGIVEGLQFRRWKVILALDATELFEKLKEHPSTSAIILDIMLNPGNEFKEISDSRDAGFHAAKKLQKIGYSKMLIFITARQDEETVLRKAGEVGALVIFKSDSLRKLYGLMR